jgi:hypothetical protein
LEGYERAKARLAQDVYDDQHGITHRLKDYETPGTYRERGIVKPFSQKAIDDFKPQWVSYEEVKGFIEYNDRLLSKMVDAARPRPFPVQVLIFDDFCREKRKTRFEDLVFRRAEREAPLTASEEKEKERKELLWMLFTLGCLVLGIIFLVIAVKAETG